MKDLTTGNPLKIIISMSIPIMLGNLFQQLYNTADTAVVGRFVGSGALAAVGATSTIYFLFFWTSMGTTNGFAVQIAQFYGAGEIKKLKKCVCMCFELAVVIGVCASVISISTVGRLLTVMNTPVEIFEDAHGYIVVIFAGLTFTLLYNMFAAIMRALGDSRTPFVFLLITSILNIVLDLLFIAVFGFGVKGAAIATVIAQIVSSLGCMTYCVIKMPIIRPELSDFEFDGSMVARLLRLGLPMGLMGALTASGIIILQFAINCYGADTIAAYTCATKIEQLSVMALNAYAMTMVNFAGQNVGAMKYDNLIRGVKACTLISVATSLLCAIPIFFGADFFGSIFIDAKSNPEVTALASMYLRNVAPFLVFYGLMAMYRSTLQGMGDSKAPLINAVIETVTRIIFTIYLIKNINFTLLCRVNPCSWGAATLIIMSINFFRIRHISGKSPA